MDASGQSEVQNFLKSKALGFFCNYLRKFKREVEDRDFFGIIEETVDKDEVAAALQRGIPPDLSEKSLKDRKETWAEVVDNNATPELLDVFWDDKATRDATRRTIMDLVETVRTRLEKNVQGRDLFAGRFKELCDLFGLSEIEIEVLLLCHILEARILESPLRSRKVNELRKLDKLLPWLDRAPHLVCRVLAKDQKLRKFNCIDDDFDFNAELNDFLYGWSNEPLEHKFYARWKGKTLPWAYFGALAEKHGEILKELIRRRNPQRGVHILLYGAPGSGKTSFAQALAHQLGLDCYAVAQDVKNDNTARTCSAPEFRFGALRLCDERVDREKSLLVVDEADDMLRGRGGGLFALFGGGNMAVGDKGLLNSLLDEVKAPCIWISNTSAEELDPSSRRRFDYSIRFSSLTSSQRLAIWRNNVELRGLKRLFPKKTLEKLADRYEVSAGGIALVLRNLADLKPKAKDAETAVEKLMAPHCALMGIQTDKGKILPAADYSLEGLNIRGDVPLERMVEAVRRFLVESEAEAAHGVDRPRMNLLLSGPPGTGKTEFVKHLGAALKTKIVVKMGADILSMWVGGTEQNIRRAFEEAEAEKAILFFDEIDGLLQDRGMAQHSWEVTQVNELLQRMENFNGVMIGATNFTDTLDLAVARRFTFKLEFRYLDDAGKRLFFERMFRAKLSPKETERLAGIPDLAPGDFRTVRQGLYYLGKAIANEDRLAALERESQAKGHSRHTSKKIGF